MQIYKFLRFFFVSSLILLITYWLPGHNNFVYASGVLDDSRFMQRFEGQWFNSKGTPVLTFHGKTINGCEITDIANLAGGYSVAAGDFLIVENNGYRKLRIAFDFTSSNPFLVFNGETLRKTTEIKHYESVGGVYLGMSKQQVLSLYGKPDSILNDIDTDKYLRFTRADSWFYKTGWAVTFYGDTVDRIAIFRGGSKRFDRTGYDCEFTRYDYQRKYGMKSAPGSFPRQIADGEYIYMDENTPCQYVVLTIYNN